MASIEIWIPWRNAHKPRSVVWTFGSAANLEYLGLSPSLHFKFVKSSMTESHLSFSKVVASSQPLLTSPTMPLDHQHRATLAESIPATIASFQNQWSKQFWGHEIANVDSFMRMCAICRREIPKTLLIRTSHTHTHTHQNPLAFSFSLKGFGLELTGNGVTNNADKISPFRCEHFLQR